MSWIETIDEDDAREELADIYAAYLKKNGQEKMPSILKVHSLSPKSLEHHIDYYRLLSYGKSPLRRYQREMIATRVSLINRCHY